jgi:hypothetical protein
MLESLNTQNQQLVQHNQRLRQEIGRVVHAALQVQQVADLYQPAKVTMPDAAYINVEFAPDMYLPNQATHGVKAQATPRKTSHTIEMPRVSSGLGDAVIEQKEGHHRRPKIAVGKTAVKPRSDLTGLWLVLVVLGVIVAAFAAGFWVVRPFLSD